MPQFLFLTLALSLVAFGAVDAAKRFRQSQVTGHFLKPAEPGFSEKGLARLELPRGFQIQVFAKNLGDPRMMLPLADGRVLVSRPKKGDIISLRDANGDGEAEEHLTIVSNMKRPHGMAVHDGELYFVAMTEVYKTKPEPDSTPDVLIENLPDVGQHENRSLAIGPDERLYVSIASTCNACADPTEDVATMLRFDLNGDEKQVFARGLRDTIGFDWHPVTKELYGMDHGVDWRGDDTPPEELNLIEESKHYGWPFCFADQKVDTLLVDDPEGTTKELFCPTTEVPRLTYQAHSAPIALKFYSGSSFPEEYRNGAFVAMHGSWNRRPPSGYKVVFLPFANGKPTKFRDFLTGFLGDGGKEHYGRPAGLAQMPDGSLLVSDDAYGVIYKVTYRP